MSLRQIAITLSGSKSAMPDAPKKTLGQAKRPNVPMMPGMHRIVPPILVFSGLVVAWQLAVDLLQIPQYLIPSPYRIYLVLVTQDPSRLFYHISVTLEEILIGFAIGSILGILIGAAIAYSPLVERTVYPVAVAVKVTPIIAIAPLLVVWFGPHVLSKVVIVAMISFFFPVVNTALGLRSVDSTLIDLMKSISATEWQVFVKVKFPSALPYIFSALKVAITAAVIGAVVGEYVGSVSGLGYMILLAASYVDTPLMFSLIITLSILGVLLFAAVAGIEKMVIPWASRQGATVVT